ncbi:hypothetical protein ACQCV6_25500 [Bacillus cereus]|uniref:hypothetical protein n=1 Tax=Bacillus cereus TaxID=1396 RepID=UPI00141944F3|nr:hypothetical protein [Bacillus cereus]
MITDTKTYTNKAGSTLIGVPPHAHQAKKRKYPKTRKLASHGENVHFLFWGFKNC